MHEALARIMAECRAVEGGLALYPNNAVPEIALIAKVLAKLSFLELSN